MQDDYTTVCLDLPEFQILDVVKTEEFIMIRMVKRTEEEACPSCGKKTCKIHAIRWQSVRDLPMAGIPVILRVQKRRFRCISCDRVFQEPYESISRYARMTRRFEAGLCGEPWRPFRELGRASKVSEGVVSRVFKRHAKEVLPKRTVKPFRVLGIDESSFKKRQKYNTVLTDVEGKRLVELLPGRSSSEVKKWLQSFPHRNQIRFVVHDLHKPFVQAIKKICPWVIAIADRFHLVRELNRQISSIIHQYRKSALKLPRGIRWLVLAGKEALNETERGELLRILPEFPRLAKAYELKEQFRALYELPDRKACYEALLDWHGSAMQSNLAGFWEFSRTVRRWEEEILNGMAFKITNGYTEGVNNKLKVIKRTGYGFHRFDTFRAKVLLSCQKPA